MKRYSGKSIFSGIAIGPILIYEKERSKIRKEKVEDIDAEISRYEEAKQATINLLHEIYEKALKEVGEINAAVFEVHQKMLEDEDYNASVLNIIQTQGINAEYAVAVTCDNFSVMFDEMEDEYFKARAADIKDISKRLIHILSGKNSETILGNQKVIIVADDLTPSETIQLDKERVLAFVTRLGSLNSHTAILARNMNIPALIGIPYDKSWTGKMAIVDGFSGELIIEPDKATLVKMLKKKEEGQRNKDLLLNLKGKEDITLDGKKIRLYANIDNVSDVANVLKNDAGGIGLFRSEFLYLEAKSFPSEEEQFYSYKTVAETMAGKTVIIRTLDIGADKQVDYFGLGKEKNPALGYRAIRICLEHIEIFKTQLRAIYRASVYGNIAIMYPMIISVDEIKKIKELVGEVKKELTEEGIPFKEIKQGIMIETPAAVMISDLLAKEVDFFSIGTNDLTQYTLAIDRQNAKLYSIYDVYHEAILRMIELVVKNAHKENIWVGICGELAADTSLTKRFLKIGIDELSVPPSLILPIRRLIRETSAK